MKTTETVYLSLGSNLGDKLNNLQNAVFLIQKRAGNITRISPVYETPAWGFEGGDFLNACLALEAKFAPEKLMDILLDIETKLGRKRTIEEGYQPRTIDIDLLFYGNEIVRSEHLTVPHPYLQQRKFVLKPLSDIAPQFYHPVLGRDLRNLLQECGDDSVLTKTKFKLYTHRKQLFSTLQFMAIEGNIGAGKTTLASKIAADFNAKLILERFADNPFLPKFYEDQSRYAFPLEMSFLADRYQQFTDDTSQFDLFKKFMISDYDIYKSLIFAKVTLQVDEFALYRKVFDFMYKEVKKPDVYVFLYQNSERLLENIKKRGRDYERNISPDYLEKINNGYMEFIKGRPVGNSVIIELEGLDFVESRNDYETVLAKIQNFIVNLTL
ncbi:2-amino-4-hydroxy-6-hydroxymethyldihydropteridine diphosphokinase [Flavobacteriaceae bacterium F89]|uniref:2-amino-4-hydroxy-6-hydroxymethyldihydropteridine pyrophosphokinase n=1 Tax=Cerina litoralis TaxID=2874477 RepID=A0AAE3JRR7_9FLAO|nr:2-amino-4-hydroxy-6-hydroxymethyldihydropteridine diphosphokinase [Cerina litoralis]MCG2459917.1 2-amino-4-hydroxy-6-hydroxymethyldihydropteridine diphosphokinase [Cerina litoralis]